MKLGGRVEAERKAQGLSQEQLADRVRRLGAQITQTGIDKIEKRDSAHPVCAPELAEALNVNEHWLRTGKGPKERTTLSRQIDADLAELEPDDSKRIIDTLNDLIAAAKRRKNTDR